LLGEKYNHAFRLQRGLQVELSEEGNSESRPKEGEELKEELGLELGSEKRLGLLLEEKREVGREVQAVWAEAQRGSRDKVNERYIMKAGPLSLACCHTPRCLEQCLAHWRF
jgi:hypothetical protein